MDHIVFNRPLKQATYFSHTGEVFHFEASGDTWGNHGVGESDGSQPIPPYGHLCSIEPGHYQLDGVDDNGDNCPSEGHYQINVSDLSDDTLNDLVRSNHCTVHGETGTIDIGGFNLSRNGLMRHSRSAVMIHGGGSNLGAAALDPNQTLLRTWGCTRVHNADLATLAALVNAAHSQGSVVIFTCEGDPAAVDG